MGTLCGNDLELFCQLGIEVQSPTAQTLKNTQSSVMLYTIVDLLWLVAGAENCGPVWQAKC